MKEEYHDSTKEAYVRPVSEVYELCLESALLQASFGEGETTDPGDGGEGTIPLSDFMSRNF